MKTTIDSYFKRKSVEVTQNNDEPNSSVQIEPSSSEAPPLKSPRVQIDESFDIKSLERDPGLRR